MEEIIGQPMQPPINFNKFLEEYQRMFKTPFTQPCSEIDLQKVLNLGDEPFRDLQDKCSLELLEHEDDARVDDFLPGFTELLRVPNINVPMNAITLKSYCLATKNKEPKRHNPFNRTPEIYIFYRVASKPSVSPSITLQPEQELKVSIRMYRPARVTHAGRTIERPVFAQEFECLGSNLLSELRDKIICICNNKRYFDVSETPDAPLPDKETDPGYFFINDTFYNDMRNPMNADYSETIRKWAKTAKGLKDLTFKVARMEETRVIDLTVSMGFPQLYQHHGNCEHVFVFSQLEVITNPCKQLIELHNYPYLKSLNRHTSRSCQTCSAVNYVFVIEGSKRLFNDPAYLCRKCFKSFLYVDGKKVGDFRAYRLNDDPLSKSENLDPNNDEMNTEDEDDTNGDDIESIIVKEEANCNEE
ncbi:snRNA-activating protein complex subunit 3 isoform X2 [Stomoxys calcitrans]|nr:snRNA-activating protein complex subunit 3 isoform X2 [Stomoxys calcitrans]